MSTEQQVREFATQYVSTYYDVKAVSIDRCSRAPQEEGNYPEEWEVLIAWGNDDFTLAMKMYDELTVIGVDGVEPPQSEYARQQEQGRKAMEADMHDIATVERAWYDYRHEGNETPGRGLI